MVETLAAYITLLTFAARILSAAGQKVAQGLRQTVDELSQDNTLSIDQARNRVQRRLSTDLGHRQAAIIERRLHRLEPVLTPLLIARTKGSDEHEMRVLPYADLLESVLLRICETLDKAFWFDMKGQPVRLGIRGKHSMLLPALATRRALRKSSICQQLTWGFRRTFHSAFAVNVGRRAKEPTYNLVLHNNQHQYTGFLRIIVVKSFSEVMLVLHTDADSDAFLRSNTPRSVEADAFGQLLDGMLTDFLKYEEMISKEIDAGDAALDRNLHPQRVDR